MRPPMKDFKREPFQCTARANWPQGKLQTNVAFDIPQDKLLVIENISATLECPIDQEIGSTQVKTIVNNVETWHTISVPKTSTFENKLNIYAGGQQVRVYADPGTTVNVLVHKNSSTCPELPPCGTTLVSISGYLISPESPRLSP